MVLGQIVPVIYVAAGLSQQLHRRVKRPARIPTALRRRRVPWILSVVPCGNLYIVDRFVDLFDGMRPRPVTLAPGVLLQIPARRAKIG